MSIERDEWLRRGYQLGHVYEGDDGRLASHYYPIHSTSWRWDWKPREPSRLAALDEAYTFVAQVYSEIWGEELAALLAVERARAEAKRKEEARRKAADAFFEEMLTLAVNPRLFKVQFRTGLCRSYMPTAEVKLSWYAEEPAVRGRGEIKKWDILVQDFSTANAVNALADRVRHTQRETARAVPFWDKDGRPLAQFPVYDDLPPRGMG